MNIDIEAAFKDALVNPTFSEEPFSKREAWLWLHTFSPLRGQKIRRHLSGVWRWKEGKVRRFLERAANAGLVRLDRDFIEAIEGGAPHAVRPGTGSWRALRQAVFERDGFACVYCGCLDDLACDHVVPRSRGGLNDMENLVTACRPCNSSKGDKLLSEWLS